MFLLQELAKKEAADEARKQMLANVAESKTAVDASPPKSAELKASSEDLSISTGGSGASVRFAPGTGGTPIMSPKNSMESNDSSEDESKPQW